MAWGKYIEYPKGEKRLMHRIIRKKYRGVNRWSHSSRTWKTLTQQRQANAVFYRLTHGVALVWPPFKGYAEE